MTQTKLVDQTLIFTPELRDAVDSVLFVARAAKQPELQQVVVTKDMVWATDSFRFAMHTIRSNAQKSFPIPVDVVDRLPQGIEIAIYAETRASGITLSWKANGKIDQANAVPNPGVSELLNRKRQGEFSLSVFRMKFLDALKSIKRTDVVSFGETVLMDKETNTRSYAVSPQIAFVRRYMIDGLKCFPDDVLTIQYGYGHEPIVLQGKAKEFTYMLMPWRIDHDNLLYSSEYRTFLQNNLKESLEDV